MELIYIIAYFVIGFIISSIITRYNKDFSQVDFIFIMCLWAFVVPSAIVILVLFHLVDLLEKFMKFIRGKN